MKYSVDLESPFAFSAYWYAAGILLIILGRVLLMFFGRFFRTDPESPIRVDRVYKACMKRIAGIERSYRSGELDTRAAHGQMSSEVRWFVQEVTGLPAQSMVYEELRRRGRPELAELIREYYGPEFSYISEADAAQAIEKGRALVEEEYRRSVKARKVRAAGAFRAVIGEELGRLMRKAPAFLRPAITDRIRSNTRKWILRIDKAFRSGELDAFNVHKQMSAAVRSFLRAATGARSDDAALEAVQAAGALRAAGAWQEAGGQQAPGSARAAGAPHAAGARQAPGRSAVAALAGPYYDPEHVCRTEREAQLSIDRGKELIEKWV